MAERDPCQECGCVEGILACVHFGELRLWLHDNSDAASPPVPGHYSATEWWVIGPERPLVCPEDSCGGHLVMNGATAGRFSSLPEAQADFARRAELLRLGEPAHA